MNRFELAWVIAAALATTNCGRTADTAEESNLPSPPAATPGAAPAPAAEAAPAAPSQVAKDAVRVPIDGMPVFGSAAALVTVVAFTDYECPYCAKADKTIQTLRAELGEDLRVVIAMRPLPMHENAALAARAVLAAGLQGKAEAMHARVFADPKAITGAGLAASARALGLDVAAFEAARTGPATAAALEQTEKVASALGASGTPTFFVNGRRLMGARPYEEFRAVVDEERGRARALVQSGVAREQVYATLMAAAPVHTLAHHANEDDDAVHDVAIDGAPARGDARAPVTVVLFSDFESPYCVKAEATMRALEVAYSGKLKVVFRHHPLPMHEHARLAARASLAADEQGRFWEYHDALVAHRDALDRASLDGYAASLGLDARRFARDLDDPRIEARVLADEAQAAALHVEGAPIAFVNGRRISGAQPLAVYRAAVDRALAAR
jgi:protein-disulfide isomerase